MDAAYPGAIILVEWTVGRADALQQRLISAQDIGAQAAGIHSLVQVDHQPLSRPEVLQDLQVKGPMTLAKVLSLVRTRPFTGDAPGNAQHREALPVQQVAYALAEAELIAVGADHH
jgi:hypothetical protein